MGEEGDDIFLEFERVFSVAFGTDLYAYNTY